MSVDLGKLQKEVMQNKLNKGFNTTDLAQEFCRAYEGLAEAFSKLNHRQEGVGEEPADVTIFILGMCEILGIDLEDELVKKVARNKTRQYQTIKSPDSKDVFVRIKTSRDP